MAARQLAVMLVFAIAPEGREEACARWYADTHFPDMLGIEGVESARLCRLDGQGVRQVGRDGELATPGLVAIYDLAHDDLDTLRTEIAQHARAFRGAGRSFDGLQVVSSSIYTLV